MATITWRSALAWLVGAMLIATGVTLVFAGPGIGAAPLSPSMSNVSHGGLPITGWPLALIAGSGLALLGAGATSLVLARRKRGLSSSR